MQTKRDKNVGKNEEFPLPRKEEALNSRKLGGEVFPKFPSEDSIIKPNKTRPSTGPKSKYPYQVSREGERRI